MQTYFYKLSGGINQAASKTALGLESKTLYWSDSKNIEILQGNGIIKQRGNTLLLALEEESEIIGIHQLKENNTYNLLLTTSSGKLFVYLTNSRTFTQLNKTISGGARPNFIDFLDGVVVGSKQDELFYINKDDGFAVESCNLKDPNNNPIKSDAICVYGGRLWVADGANLHYSALGTYNNFTTSNDAGYINNFHTDTNDITALKSYKDYLAIYKRNSVYLLSGKSNEDFAIVPFADKGTASCNSVITVNNKQYFVNQGIFSLEQAGLLSQIQLGDEISLNIKPEFEKFDKSRFDEIIVLNYGIKNQIWFFIPYKNDDYFHNIWIYDYIEKAWFKRVLPQNIKSACIFNENILAADSIGNVYVEDLGSTFNGSAIEFMWKSPFLATGNSNVRKTIEEFYFILDESYDNNFNFSVCKDYDNVSKSDEDSIYSSNSQNLIWDDENSTEIPNSTWSKDSEIGSESVYSQWAISSNSVFKAEISEANYSVQLCVEGNKLAQGMAIIGLEFKEIYVDE